MSTELRSDDPSRQVMALARRVDQLTAELDLARLHTQVAITVAPLIYRVVAAPDDHLAVVADVVDCWRRLDPVVRAGYTTGRPGGGINGFANDYPNAAEEGPADCPDFVPGPYATDPIEEHRGHAWYHHLADLRRRTDRREPPPAAWLARFPLPND